MTILHDLQEQLEDVSIGKFNNSIAKSLLVNIIRPWGNPEPVISVREYDGVRYISIENRILDDSGIELVLSAVPDLRVGDKISITGRIGEDAPLSNWGVCMFVKGEEVGHLDQHIAPTGLYNVNHVIDTDELERGLVLRTVQWGESTSVIDFYVDSIIITRQDTITEIVEDIRPVVYSFANDRDILTSRTDRPVFEGNNFLRRSGVPEVHISEHNGKRMLTLKKRAKDWDAIDILFSSMDLIRGNIYKISVTGIMGDDAPEKATVLFQGIPGFSWRSNVQVRPNEEFRIEHVLSPSEMESWTSLRITTDGASSQSTFTIKSIEVKPVGVVNA